MKLRSRWLMRLFCLLLPLAGIDSVKAQVIELPSPLGRTGSRFGLAVKGLSDWTGDGIGELAVTTQEGIPRVGEAGSVYILNGKDFSVVHRLISPNPALPSGFGFDLAELPDADGDKIPEIIIPSERLFRVEIFSGASGKILQTLDSPDPTSARFGETVAGLGSTRPNSVPTVVVSSPGCCDFGQRGNNSRIHIFNPVTGELLFTVEQPDDTPWFGVNLANIGDIDGDGRDDLAAGAGPLFAFGGAVIPGAAYILSGETGKVLHQLIPPLPATVDFRWDVAAVPDVNGDGKTDVLVGIGGGARLGAPVQSGHAYLFSGADGKLLRSLVSPGQKARGGFGWTVAGVPDVTGDGAGELLIGAATNPSFTGFQTYGERKMHLMDGATGQVIQSFASPYAGEGFGWTIAVLGGKDGRLKNLIAGVQLEKSNSGRVFAFPLRFLTATRSDEGIRVSLTATDDKSYDLQASPDLQTWTTLTTLKGVTTPATFLDAQAKGMNRRFYRAREANALP